MNLSDALSIFAILARAEGRKQAGFVPADFAPLINEDGEYILSMSDEIKILTEAVRGRLSALETLWEGTRLSEAVRLPFGPSERPLGPFRERIEGSFQAFSRMEVTKAIWGLSQGKAPGPDGIPAEIFKRLPTLVPVLRVLFNGIYSRGGIPKTLCRVHVVLLKKPGKDPRVAANRRPISLINTMMKILEGIVYSRIILRVEPLLCEGQYAYRRERGTERHLASVMDRIHRALLQGRWVYVVSFDIGGAFDRVAHHGLAEALKSFGIDSYTRRLVRSWIRGRRFAVRRKSPRGVTLGDYTQITSGLPQGGILSPVLWLMFFNSAHQELEALRETRGDDAGAY